MSESIAKKYAETLASLCLDLLTDKTNDETFINNLSIASTLLQKEKKQPGIETSNLVATIISLFAQAQEVGTDEAIEEGLRKAGLLIEEEKKRMRDQGQEEGRHQHTHCVVCPCQACVEKRKEDERHSW